MVILLRRPLTEAEAGSAAGWAYPPPFDMYDVDAADPGLFLRWSADGTGYHPALDEAGQLIAFAVLGAEARVRGQEPAPGVVDVGMGVHPDATSRGLGTALIGQVVALAAGLTGATSARAAVAAFNERALALCRGAGFVVVRDFAGAGGRPFRELVLPLG